MDRVVVDGELVVGERTDVAVLFVALVAITRITERGVVRLARNRGARVLAIGAILMPARASSRGGACY